MAFVKLDCGILNSTLWCDRPAREVFLTALLLAVPDEIKEPTPTIKIRSLEDADFVVPPGWYGFVPAASTGILRHAQVGTEEGMAALERLASPEYESRSQEHEGRRMVRVNGGFVLLNFDRFRQKDHTASERSARYRQRKESTGRMDHSAFRAEWKSLVAYYDGLCAYCGKRPWTDIDHIFPTSKGGKHEIKNVAPACRSCNSSKSDNISPWPLVKPHPFRDA